MVHYGKHCFFVYYAVLSRIFLVTLIFSWRFAYFIIISSAWQYSFTGKGLGLILCKYYIILRHVSVLNWYMQKATAYECKLLFIPTL